jgi:hypothetical protein
MKLPLLSDQLHAGSEMKPRIQAEDMIICIVGAVVHF